MMACARFAAGVAPDTPSFTIVIPTYDRPTGLQRVVRSLMELDYPRERFDVVIVDDGGDAPVRSLLAGLDVAFRLEVVRQANRGPASARNHGARLAHGNFLAFTDDDCAPESGWLRALALCLLDDPGRLVGGRTINGIPENPFSAASQDLIGYMQEHYKRESSPRGFFPSNNIAMAANAFREIGGFDESFPLAAGEDRHFCERWLASGRLMGYAPDAVVQHHHSLTLRTFWRQHFNYGRGAFHLRRARSHTRRHGQRLEPLSFYLGLLTSPLRGGRSLKALRDVTLMVIMQLATATGFVREWLAGRQD